MKRKRSSSVYLDYWRRRRNHRHYRSSRRRGSSGRWGSDRWDISSDGWHRGGSDDGRLRHGWRDALERGRRGDRRHGHCLLCSFQTTKWNIVLWCTDSYKCWQDMGNKVTLMLLYWAVIGLANRPPAEGHRKSTKDTEWDLPGTVTQGPAGTGESITDLSLPIMSQPYTKQNTPHLHMRCAALGQSSPFLCSQSCSVLSKRQGVQGEGKGGDGSFWEVPSCTDFSL